jgi:spore coat polysaccharide biosynthesis protein SpsF (cytidylyltransferase family)
MLLNVLHDDINNGDCPFMSHKLISAPELSKLLKTSHSPLHDAINNGDCPCLSHKLISVPELSKEITIV